MSFHATTEELQTFANKAMHSAKLNYDGVMHYIDELDDMDALMLMLAHMHSMTEAFGLLYRSTTIFNESMKNLVRSMGQEMIIMRKKFFEIKSRCSERYKVFLMPALRDVELTSEERICYIDILENIMPSSVPSIEFLCKLDSRWDVFLTIPDFKAIPETELRMDNYEYTRLVNKALLKLIQDIEKFHIPGVYDKVDEIYLKLKDAAALCTRFMGWAYVPQKGPAQELSFE